MISFLMSLRELLANATLMGQALAVALVAPLIFWLVPASWRLTVLLGISAFSLLQAGLSIEYIVILLLLLSLTWAVISDVTMPSPQPLSRGELGIGLPCVTVFGLVIGVSQYFGLQADVVPPLLIWAAIGAGLALVGGSLVRERALYSALKRQILPISAILVVCLPFAPNISMTVERFSPAKSVFALMLVGTLVCCTVCLSWARRATHEQKRLIAAWGIGLIVLLFIIFKWPTEGSPLIWFGFSYIAFRFLHVLLDQRLNLSQPHPSPREWATYSLFFSAQSVGPIDRWPRFANDLRAEKVFDWDTFVAGWLRILQGAIKKFFIADILLGTVLPGQIPLELTPTAYAWFQLYAYAFYLYCDFSGFVDIAIGTAQLVGVHLPENFDRPYTKGSLAQFWQSWHITLSGWLRTYVFLPLSRSLLRTSLRRVSWLTVLIANLVTMSLIGLWHGLTWNYLAWGLWHAIGLFIHKLFSDRTRRRQLQWRKIPWKMRTFHVLSVFLTFHYVVLGWVFFALKTPQDSLSYLALLIGIRL